MLTNKYCIATTGALTTYSKGHLMKNYLQNDGKNESTGKE
jgi:hypothetical protein